MLGERGHELGGDRPRQHAEVGRRRRQLDRSRLEAREVEQLGGELAEPVDLLAHLADELPPRLLVERLVLDQLEKAAEREDRRAQLVRGGRDEAPPRAPRGPRAGSACGRARAEATELVARGVAEVRLEVALRDALRGALEAQHADRQRSRDEHPGEQRDEQPDRGGEQDPRAHQRDRSGHVVQRHAVDDDAADRGRPARETNSDATAGPTVAGGVLTGSHGRGEGVDRAGLVRRVRTRRRAGTVEARGFPVRPEHVDHGDLAEGSVRERRGAGCFAALTAASSSRPPGPLSRRRPRRSSP